MNDLNASFENGFTKIRIIMEMIFHFLFITF